MDFYKRALELNEKTVNHRRYLHKNAETGLDTPVACRYVTDRLIEYGLEPVRCGHGVTATIGSGSPTLLLRADMDALPMAEESGEPFACPTGKEAHTCGHDMHAAMLLSAARLLKEQENRLRGSVKFMFQPAEETLEGCRNMIENGILEDPKPDAALAFHVAAGKIPLGTFMYNSDGVMMSSVDVFRIDITGKGGHGAYPNLAVDPLNIAVKIYSGLQTLISHEAESDKNCVLTIGNFHGGSASNIIPDMAFLEGNLRTNDASSQKLLFRRMTEIVEGTAKVYGGTAKVTTLSSVPPLICNKELTGRMVEYMKELPVPNSTPVPDMSAGASEDFALIAEAIPAALIYLSAGFPDERGEFSAHNPKVRFNEEVLPIGVAGLAHCAVRWLEENSRK